jgi:hypothetical protein
MTKISLQDKISYLEKKWKRKVKYSCHHCLDVAFVSVVENISGYITDEELIQSSGNTLHNKENIW